MRLTTEQQATIKQLADDVFGLGIRVSLFGSRLDDSVRGGDIDLLITSDKIIENKVHKSLKLTARLQMSLGDQPIDVLVIDPETKLNPIHKHAQSTAQIL